MTMKKLLLISPLASKSLLGGDFQVKKAFLVLYTILVVGGIFFSGSASAADWRFPVGLTYVHGFWNVADIFENNLEKEGLPVEITAIPFGLSFHPYYLQSDDGPVRGEGIGIDIGPLMFISVTGDVDRYFFNVPINLNLRYTSNPRANISLYVRGGVMYNIASGDYVKGTTPGPFGAIGIEFLRQRRVGLGMEIAYDISKIEVEKKTSQTTSVTENVKPNGLMISIYVVF